jgi:hypothetical protein
MTSNTESQLSATQRSGSRWLWFHKLSSPPYAFATAMIT